MALGLLLLVSVNKENLYLSGQPEITYFKLVYKQYTNFSIETIPQYFKTDPDFSRKTTINISKNENLYLIVKNKNLSNEINNDKTIYNKVLEVKKYSLLNTLEEDIILYIAKL